MFSNNAPHVHLEATENYLEQTKLAEMGARACASSERMEKRALVFGLCGDFVAHVFWFRLFTLADFIIIFLIVSCVSELL